MSERDCCLHGKHVSEDCTECEREKLELDKYTAELENKIIEAHEKVKTELIKPYKAEIERLRAIIKKMLEPIALQDADYASVYSIVNAIQIRLREIAADALKEDSDAH